MILYEIIREEDDEKYVPLEIEENDYQSIIDVFADNWLEMLNTSDEKKFNFYSEQTKKIERYLYKKKRKLYEHYRNTSEEKRLRRRISPELKKKPGRKRLPEEYK